MTEQIFEIISTLFGIGVIVLFIYVIIKIRSYLDNEEREKRKSNSPPPMPSQYTQNQAYPPNAQQFQPQQAPPEPKQELPYRKKRILTEHERNFYSHLKAVSEELGLICMCQVCLSEIVFVPRGTENYMSWFGYLRGRHVDFVLCNQDFSTAVVIELDDSSHDREKRKERDEKVNKILESAGIKIIHFRYWTPEQIKKEVTEIVKPPIAI